MIEVKRLAEIVGAGHISREPAALNEYSRDISFVHSIKPGCIVKPRSTKDVEKIVKLANDTRTPLVPVSSGFPHFRGDTVPGMGGAVIVDLSGMKKIIRVDRPNRVAMCEPGVTFGELIPAVKKEGLRLNLPLLPRKTKSVVGSLLEREPVTMPGYHWDIADPLDCVEIVFGTGDLFRTGGAAGPGTIEEQLLAGGAQDEPLGPGQADWHRAIQGAQGTLGIVTWATVRCELLPTVEEPYLVGSSQLDKILDLVHWLIRLRLVNECFVLNDTGLAAVLARRWPGDYLKIKNALPSWILFFNIAGYDYLPEERVNYQRTDMLSAARRAGLEPEKRVGSVSADGLLAAVGYPSAEPYWKLRFKGACHDIFFLSIYDKLPELIGVMYDEAGKAGYPTPDIGIYLQPIVQGTGCHGEFNLFYDPADRRESERVRELSTSVIKNLLARGAFFSRPYGRSAGMIINRDAATASALRKIKMIVDPNNIMNPGKLCF
ncbi:MAG TPA: FAD-binding oxidoreductase [Dehalococcoidales bacterium]|nr:FAD-binding oxidoreductase [Dehalococcoidales bacterium]